MKGIELSTTDQGKLQIRCLEHDRIHTGTSQFCCWDLMVRAIMLGIRELPDVYRARVIGQPEPKDLTGNLFDIATTPLLGFNSNREDLPIE